MNGAMMQNMMRMWGMNQGMMNRGYMMMHAPLLNDDPAAILGLQSELSLTPEQVSKLQTIQKKAGEDARTVLTDNQQEKLSALPTGPGSMAQMYGQMIAHRQQMRNQYGKQSGKKAGTPWPMIQQMMGNGMMDGQTPQSGDN